MEPKTVVAEPFKHVYPGPLDFWRDGPESGMAAVEKSRRKNNDRRNDLRARPVPIVWTTQ